MCHCKKQPNDFQKWLYHFIILPAMNEIASCHSSSPMFCLSIFLILALLVGMKWHLLVFSVSFPWWFLFMLIDCLYIFLPRVSIEAFFPFLSTYMFNIELQKFVTNSEYKYQHIYVLQIFVFSECAFFLVMSSNDEKCLIYQFFL